MCECIEYEDKRYGTSGYLCEACYPRWLELSSEKVRYGLTAVQDAIEKERDRQDAKWGREFPGRTWHDWLTILAEEFGEVAKAILEAPYREDGVERIREELVQVAAVAQAALEFGAYTRITFLSAGDG